MYGLPIENGAGETQPAAGDGERHHAHGTDHLALLYEESSEQMAAVVPFLERGLERGERCLYVTHETAEADVVDALRTSGVDVAAARERGALSIYTAEETYLASGSFDRDAMLDFWREALAESRDAHAGIRAAAEMTWALDGGVEHDRLAAYESLLNELYADDDYVVLCQYNRNRFPSDVLSNVIRTHPLLVNDEVVHTNEHYTPPADFSRTDRPSLDIDRTVNRIRGDAVVTTETAVTGETTDDTERILLAFADDRNRRVLGEWLETQYDEVVTAASPDDLSTAFDLCLLDAATFAQHRETLREAKERAEPQLLPYLLVQRDDTVPTDETLRRDVDEILTLPTDKETMAWRIDTLLDMRELSRQLARKNERIEHLASAAAHDLRNPLTVAKGWLETVDGGEAIDRIEHAHEQMEKLIDNVLMVAKAGNAPTEEDYEPVDLSALVEDCWEVVPTERAELRIEEGIEQTVWVKPVFCRQLFENLFRNAIEHGGDSVSVRVGAIDDIGFYVEDDGTGIPVEEAGSVFDDGYTTGSGSGLGLTVVKRVAEYHGWELHLTRSDAGGARFELVGIDSDRP